MKGPNFIPLCLVLFSIVGSTAPPSRGAVTSGRVRLEDSIREVAIGAPDSGPHRVRETLTATESAESLNLVISLRMRNFGEFQSVIQSGRTVSPAEMEAHYLPLKADYDRVAAWLRDEGFVPTLVDANHTNLFFRGTIGGIAGAMDVSFARVATIDGEFSSAITAPSLPAEFASAVLGIDGLQPHIQMHAPKPGGNVLGPDFVHPTRTIPADILAAYHVPANLNGAGQTIAIFAPAVPLVSDLATFYQLTGTNEIPTSFTVVPVNGGPISGAYTTGEVTFDTEWSTGIAPGANLRIYATPDGSLSSFIAVCTHILNEGIAKVVSSSYSNPETSFASASLQSASQLFAQMAAAGITIFHGAGDNGSYGASNAPEYPTTDPYVTALGGTFMTFDANSNEASETVWPNTGGGYSTFFPQPSWQTGPGVPIGTMRCVPDAAAPAATMSANGLGSLLILNGSASGFAGDSCTGPVWAGLAAIINQARANVGLPTLGLLGPKIYPLMGTNAFTDITTGSNGAYSAGAGYDLCTGIGTPNVTNLINSLTLTLPPSFTLGASPASVTVATGRSVAFNAMATGIPAPTYQWTLNGSTTIPGATGTTDSVLLVTGATAANVGIYTCTATNTQGSVQTSATLAVVTTASPGYLTNLSSRVTVGTGGNILIAGFVIAGSGSMDLLLRGVGPALIPAPFGVTGALTNTQLTLYDTVNPNDPLPIVTNSGWSNAFTLGSSTVNVGPQAATLALMNTLGAFTNNWAVGSPDSALEVSPPTGGYTAQISGVGSATGIALAEVYDVDAYNPATRLVNLSTRAQVGTGSNILIGGFVIGGSTAETLLIRAVGPTLAEAPYGVPGTITQPVLTIYAGSTPIYANSNWGDDSTISAAINTVGAFPLSPTSTDAALLITLPPASNYTAQVSGLNSTTGVALVEIYELY